MRLLDCFLLVTPSAVILLASSLDGFRNFPAAGLRLLAPSFLEDLKLLDAFAFEVAAEAFWAGFSSGDGSRNTDGEGIVIVSAIRAHHTQLAAIDGEGFLATSPCLEVIFFSLCAATVISDELAVVVGYGGWRLSAGVSRQSPQR